MKAALLILHLNWRCNEKSILIDDGVTLQSMESSKVQNLYDSVCETMNFHDGDPFEIETVILFEEEQIDEAFDLWHTSDSAASVICNMIAICTGLPLPYYAIIFSKDNFESYSGNPVEIHYRYDLFESLGTGGYLNEEIKIILKSIGREVSSNFFISPVVSEELKNGLKNFYSLKENSRIGNAFDFYFNAWYCRETMNTCINLTVVLESLFSPSSNNELIHQIAFNTSHFIGRNKEERERIFKLVKKFYNLRSKIVHGASAKFEDLQTLTPVVFVLCSEILKKLLTSSDLCDVFSNESKREVLINEWLFR